MGGRGGSSGLSGGGKEPEFQGSEKQVKWANDIVGKAKDSLDSALQELKEDYEYEIRKGSRLGERYKNEIENETVLNEISKNVLSNLSRSWDAKTVIDNRSDFGRDSIHIRQTLGMFESDKGDSVSVRRGGGTYNMEELRKNSSQRKKIESELIEYLKKHKSYKG